jgi:hypothetical protein
MTTLNTKILRTAARRSTARLALALCLPLAMLAGTGAMAQSEPTLDQVYQEAQAGRVDHALQMMQPVLQAHPDSAKAHYVDAELQARLGRTERAREELAVAERLAPSLPFARADAVQSLRRQLETPQAAYGNGVVQRTGSSGSMPWGILFAIFGGGLIAWLLMRMGRPQFAPASPAGMGFPAAGTGAGWPSSGMAPVAPSGSGGLGQQVVGGLATGLAVGAGVMAAESIGHRLFGNDSPSFGAQRPRLEPMLDERVANPDLGGRDFGIDNASSWDDAAPGGGGGDWDT